MMLKLALGVVAASHASAVFLARDKLQGGHVVMTCDYNVSQVFDLPAHQEPSAFFTKNDWHQVRGNIVTENADGVGGWGGSCTCPDGVVYEVGDNDDDCESLACIGGTSGTCQTSAGNWSHREVDCASEVAFDQGRRIAAFTRMWNAIPKFFSRYFPDAKWWLDGYALLGAIRTATTSPWITTEELTVSSDSFNTEQVYMELLNISRDNSNGPIDRVAGASCHKHNHCNVIRFPKDVDETGSVVLVIKMLPHREDRLIGRFVDLRSGTFVDVSTLGKEEDTPLNRECVLDGNTVNTPLDPVKYLKNSRYPDINYEAKAGQVYWKTKREGMQCTLWECLDDLPSNVEDMPDPFQITFAIPQDEGLVRAGWTPVPRSATNLESCTDVTDQMASFTGPEGEESDPNELGRIHVKAKCRPEQGESEASDEN